MQMPRGPLPLRAHQAIEPLNAGYSRVLTSNDARDSREVDTGRASCSSGWVRRLIESMDSTERLAVVPANADLFLLHAKGRKYEQPV